MAYVSQNTPMKTLYISVAFLLLGFGTNAQTEAQLAEWQANNPGKLVMSRTNYDLLDAETQKLIESTVVFKDEIGFGIFGIGDTSLDEASSASYTERDFIKEWMAEHQDVKIVTRSQYNASRPDIQAIYDQPHIIVLIGEVLTKQDILNY